MPASSLHLMQTGTSIDYKELYEQSQLQLLELRQQLDQLKKMIFGSRQERFAATDSNTSQLSLDIQAEPVEAISISDAKKITYIRTGTTLDQKPLVHPGLQRPEIS